MGTTENSSVPVLVSGGYDFASLAVANRYVCAITTGKQLHCWGLNNYGQLGNGTTTASSIPVIVSGDNKFNTVSTGKSHACAVSVGSETLCWGRNVEGQLGIGNFDVRSLVPVSVSTGQTFTSVAAGNAYTCGLTNDNKSYCWGDNTYYQLGSDVYNEVRVTEPVSGDKEFVLITAGNNHACGKDVYGQSYCWGYNYWGQLGNGTSGEANNSPSPLPVHN
jgi:alpha-tubulin suppressor-like RCC1 family protein